MWRWCAKITSHAAAAVLCVIVSVAALSGVIAVGERDRKPGDPHRSISDLGTVSMTRSNAFAATLGVLAFFNAYVYFHVIVAGKGKQWLRYTLAAVAAGGIVIFQTCVGALSTRTDKAAHYAVAVLCFASYIYGAAAAWYTHYGLQRVVVDVEEPIAYDELVNALDTSDGTLPQVTLIQKVEFEFNPQWTPLSCASLLVPVVEVVFIITFTCDTLQYYWGEWVTAYVALLAPLLYVYTLSHEPWWRWNREEGTQKIVHTQRAKETLSLRF